MIVGESRERLTGKGEEQICFHLMDRQRRSVACIAHGLSVDPEMFKEGQELVMFYAVGRDGFKKGPGSIWLFNSSYVLALGSFFFFLPGSPIEEVTFTS